MPAVESTFTAEDRDDFVLSARYGELEDLNAYLDKGMNVSARDENGNTALHMAAANGHTGLNPSLHTQASSPTVPVSENLADMETHLGLTYMFHCRFVMYDSAHV